jgi:hypothetical protein
VTALTDLSLQLIE